MATSYSPQDQPSDDKLIRFRGPLEWVFDIWSVMVSLGQLLAIALIYLGILILVVSVVGTIVSILPGFTAVVVLLTAGLAMVGAAPTVAGWVTNRLLSAWDF